MLKFVGRAIALLIGAIATTVCAQTFPDRPVTIVVPFTPAGVTDLYARSIANRLSQIWKQSVIVENRPGGGTVTGTQYVARAPGDGYTLLLTSYGFTSNQIIRKSLPYDPASLTPLIMLGNSASMLVVPADSPLKTIEDVYKLAKSSPGAFLVASSGNGSSPHIAAELFASQIPATITHVPYKGTAPAMTDLLAGRVHGLFDGPSSIDYVRAGKLRAIGIAFAHRHPGAPEVPTFRELGMDFQFGSWFGFFIPSGTPESLQKKLYADLRAAIDHPETRAQIAKGRLLMSKNTQAEFQELLKKEADRLRKLVEKNPGRILVE
jgi:tripartite-type tricarboxylate transporter receptor subunit TctC